VKRIELNDFQASWQQHREAVRSAVDRVGESGWFILGPEVEAFERALAQRWGLDHAVGCGSGLDAIELGLRAAGIAPGDQVLTTPLSAFATSLAIVRAGGVPVFADVDDAGLIDLALCDALLEAGLEGGEPIRFMVPVHLYGHSLDLAQLERLQETRGVAVVEDCAQAIGATHEARAVGSVGVAAAVSFYPTKNLGALGDGGAVLTSRDEVAANARCLRDYGQRDRFDHVMLGMNSRLDELQAAILARVFLPDLERATRQRIATATRYRREIRNDALRLPEPPAGSSSVWHLFPVLVEASERDAEQVRAGFREHLDAAAISSGVHFPRLIPDQPALCGLGSTQGVDRARAFARREVSLPIHPHLSDEDVDRVVEACNAWEPA